MISPRQSGWPDWRVVRANRIPVSSPGPGVIVLTARLAELDNGFTVEQLGPVEADAGGIVQALEEAAWHLARTAGAWDDFITQRIAFDIVRGIRPP